MKYYKKIKLVTFFLLAAQIIISLMTCLYFFDNDYNKCLIWFCLSLFLVVIPEYYVYLLVDKAKDSCNEHIDGISEAIKTMDDEKFYQLSLSENNKQVCHSLYQLKDGIAAKESLRKTVSEILVSAASNSELDKFLENVMPKVMEVVDSNWIVFYITNKTSNKLEIKSSIGFGKSLYSQFDISIGEGFVGQAANKNKIEIIKDIPDDSVFVSKTFIGKIKPKNIMLVPVNDCNNRNEVLGVIAVASLYEYTEEHKMIMDEIKDYVSYAIINGNRYNKTLRLTNELKFQNQLIQNLNEDLENKIKERTVFLNNIINSMTDTAIVSVDNSNIITMFNNAAENLFKINKSEAIGKSIKSILKNLPELEYKFIDRIETVKSEKEIIEFVEIPKGNGVFYSANVEFFALYNEVGECSGATIVVRDTSFVKTIIQSAELDQNMIDALLQESENAIAILNDEGIIELSNMNVGYMLGLGSANICGRKFMEFFDDSAKVINLINEIISTREKKSVSFMLKDSGMKIMLKVRLISEREDKVKRILVIMH